MIIKLYNWTKKDNSTARPTENTAVTVSGTIKGAVSMTAPVIMLENPADVSTITKYGTKYNYAYVPAFGRYYWIADKVIEQSGIITMQFTIDILATYGNDIRATTAYVTRNSNVYNGNYADTAYPTSATPNVIRNAISWQPLATLSNGVFIIGTSSDTGTANQSGVNYWKFSISEYNKLVKAMTNATTLAELMGRTVVNDICVDLADSVKGLTAEMYVAMYNPLQYIVSVVFYPIAPIYYEYVGTDINFTLGNIEFPDLHPELIRDLQFTGRFGFDTVAVSTPPIEVAIPHHPQMASRGAFLRQPPYSQYHMSVAGFGEFDIDAALIGNATTLYLKMVTDFRDGSAMLLIDTNKNGMGNVTQIRGKCGIPWQLGQRAADFSISGLIASGITSAMAITGNLLSLPAGGSTESAPMPFADAGQHYNMITGEKHGGAGGSFGTTTTNVKDVKSSIIDGVRMINRQSYAGSVGTIADLVPQSYLELTYYNIAETRDEDIGRPLNEEKTLSTLTGFTMCLNPHCLPLSATKSESDAINAALSAGVILDWSGY